MLPDQGRRDALKGRVRETPESPSHEVVFTFRDPYVGLAEDDLCL